MLNLIVDQLTSFVTLFRKSKELDFSKQQYNLTEKKKDIVRIPVMVFNQASVGKTSKDVVPTFWVNLTNKKLFPWTDKYKSVRKSFRGLVGGGSRGKSRGVIK